MMGGALVLAMHDARRTRALWQRLGLRAAVIAGQLGCDPDWPAIEAHIVDELVLDQLRRAGVTPFGPRQLDLFEPGARRAA